MRGYAKITAEYYSKWLGRDGILDCDVQGIEYVYSRERNTVQYGYGKPFDIYVLCRKNRAVVSYGKKAEDRLHMMKDAIGNTKSPEEIRKALERVFDGQADHSIKYVFKTRREIFSEAKVMTPEDYSFYEDFWLECNPGCGDTEWLREYYDEMQKKHMCIGVFTDRRLVSCTDGPGMPYMEDEVREIGINTLSDYRGCGYAAAACSKCISEILNDNKVPLWSTSKNNMASRKLAEKVGFEEFAEVITMTI